VTTRRTASASCAAATLSVVAGTPGQLKLIVRSAPAVSGRNRAQARKVNPCVSDWPPSNSTGFAFAVTRWGSSSASPKSVRDEAYQGDQHEEDRAADDDRYAQAEGAFERGAE
jgi:hypothetical protein